MNRFEKINPIVLMFFYASVTIISMFATNPFIILISFISSVCFYANIADTKQFLKDIRFYFILFLIITFTNPLICQKGSTVLFYIFKIGITFESIVYGIYISGLIITVMTWFKTYNVIMTNDKSMYVFSKILPKTSMVLTVSLRFVPRVKEHIQTVKNAQMAVGMHDSGNSIKSKLKSSSNVLYSTIAWLFDNSLDTANSMDARGYRTSNRTSFSIFKFTTFDLFFLLTSVLLTIISVYSMALGNFKFSYYPKIEMPKFTSGLSVSYICFAFLCFLPLILNIIERVKWKYSISKIS